MPATVTCYNKLINFFGPCAIPCLVSLGPCFKPCYRCTDSCCCRNNRNPDRPSATSNPIVVFCYRTVKDIAAYKEAFSKYAEDAQAGSAGIRAIFSFVDPDTPNTVVQFYWYDSPGDFITPPANVEACYVGTPKTDYCQIWGGWTDEFKSAISTTTCAYSFVREVRGFIKEYGEKTKKGFASDGTGPMIWISKRDIKPGRMEVCGDNFQKGTDMMYGNAPAALSVAEYTDAVDTQSTWALRVFNDYDKGFKKHFPVPSFILFRMVFNVIPEWVPGKFAIGYSFSSKDYIDKAVASNAGNKSYKAFHWETDLIGPRPDFAKAGAQTQAPKQAFS